VQHEHRRIEWGAGRWDGPDPVGFASLPAHHRPRLARINTGCTIHFFVPGKAELARAAAKLPLR
jgi:hypothetical protein